MAVVFLVSGLDDFFIDVFYILRSAYRRLFVLPKFTPLTEEHLMLPAEQAVAVLVPAWDESSIIGNMLENMLSSLVYSRYHVFVGTYPNDPATAEEVERIGRVYDNVHRVSCPHPGPTNKADCLNWIYRGIRSYERRHQERFDILVLHDAEDVVHPLSLKLFNYLIPRKDMVQLPVFVLEAKWHQLTAGHYMDEFAEYHLKDLLVRERLAGIVPGAGVGCGYSRRGFDLVAKDYASEIFSTRSLTEDYDFSFRLSRHGLKQIFVKKAIRRTVSRRGRWSGKTRVKRLKEYVATREYFPATFWAAVRQKSRWIMGIAFQGWASLGWKGGGWTKYMLFRDRKVIVTNQVNALAYVVVVTVAALWISNRYFPEAYRYPPLVEQGTWLWSLVLVDTFFLCWRLFLRVLNVYRIYGWVHALLSLPRVVWANSLNFVAALRAFYLFARFLATGQLAWEKTRHAFPTRDELQAFHARLGDLLVERRYITTQQLEEALERQSYDPRPLGALLVDMGLVGEEELLQVLGLQLRLSTAEIDPYQTPREALEALPHSLAAGYSVYPLELKDETTLVVASDLLLTAEQLEELEKAAGRKIELRLTTRSDLAFAIRRGYERLEREEAAERLVGRRLLDGGLVSPEALEEALRAQRQSYRRLGDVLLERGMITASQLQEAVEGYRARGARGFFGEYLVREDTITLEQLQEALHAQSDRLSRLGEILVAQGAVTREALEKLLGGTEIGG